MGCGVNIVGSESWSVLIPSSVSFKHLSAGLILWSGCESLYWLDNESLYKPCDRFLQACIGWTMSRYISHAIDFYKCGGYGLQGGCNCGKQ